MDNKNYFNFEFTCKHILYRNLENGFSIMDCKILHLPDTEVYEQKSIVVKGTFEKLEENDSFRCFAKWVDDKKYGKQIEVFIPTMIASSDISGIKRFLRRYIKGLGPACIEKITSLYGTDTLDKIRESPHNLECIKGISSKKAEMIHNQLLENEKIEKLSLFLFNSGVSNFNDIVTIYENLGDDAQDMILSNPYCLCDYLSISKFSLSDTIAINLGHDTNSLLRISKIINYYLYSHCYSSGDMYVEKDYLYSSLPLFIKKNQITPFMLSIDVFNKALQYMQDINSVVIDSSSKRGDLVYISSLYSVEEKTAQIIKKINTRRILPVDDSIYDSFFEKYTASHGIESDEIQKKAVRYAYENRLSVITGGPGTGKTQTINTIISFIEEIDPDSNIALCSPTGRASKRISEVTGKEAFTIHRLLGIVNNDISDNSCSDLDVDYLICDECSMLGSVLFYKLILAVSNSANTSLILVGDINQLPPVDIGLPFRDIIESGKVPTVCLKTLFRQAINSQIYRNSRLLLDGVTDIGINGLTFDKTKQDCFFFQSNNVSFSQTLILKSIEQLLALGINFDDIMVLSPTRKTALGVEEINKLIQAHFNPESTNTPEYHSSKYILRVNDRVMQTSNDYELGVFNGDIGIVTSVDIENETLIVTYDDSFLENGFLIEQKKEVLYEFSYAKELELAYATTVHKAQGSEYPVVIMPLSNMFYNLSRTILYTAFTRAKKRLVCIGEVSALVQGIKKSDNLHRRTLLKERI